MSYYTEKEAIKWASLYGLEQEVKDLMAHGFTPDEALNELSNRTIIHLEITYSETSLSKEDLENLQYLSIFNLEDDYLDYRREGYDPSMAYEKAMTEII